MLKLGQNVVDAPKFEELDKELGLKLLSPIVGKCFNYVSDPVTHLLQST
jgi:hypothetical protein